MQIDSSAMPTCLRLRSTVECTATVRMPSAWHARSTRNAISPRFAMTTLSSISSPGVMPAKAGIQVRRKWIPAFAGMATLLANDEHRFVELDRLPVADEHGEDG